MATPTDIKYVVIDPDVLGGRPSILGHRIGVIHVATWTQQGMTPQDVADVYGLSLAEIYAALAFYYDHRGELDQQAAEDDARLAAYAQNDQSPVAETLRQRLRERFGGDEQAQQSTAERRAMAGCLD